jgi:uncharacterized protein (TIGR03663 family)
MDTDRWADAVTPARAVFLVAALCLCSRFLLLGVRAVHWDEARVGYWILRTIATGDWTYRPIIHGPFMQHTTRFVIEGLGATTFALRVVPAVVGGLLPLAALCFRSRLADREVVALAVVLAANPLLVHYSRFLRSDIALAAFALVTVGSLVRALDTRRVRWLYVAVLSFGLALTTKENAVLYPMSWLGALSLVAAWHLWREPEGERTRLLRERARAVGRGVWRWRGHGLAALAGAVIVVVFFYAPRSGTGGVGLWNALADPSLLPAVLRQATVEPMAAVGEVWLDGGMRKHSYLRFFVYYVVVLVVGAGPLVALAVYGVARDRARPLVAFCGWWGLSGLVGYPFVADIRAPWLAVHIVVALAIPAAIGLVAVLDRLRKARVERDRVVAAGLAILLVVAGVQTVVVAGATSYRAAPSELNPIAQSGQPGSDLNAVMGHAVAAAERDAFGPDVLYVGERAVRNESWNDDPAAAGPWYDRLPLPWYTEAADLTVTSERDPQAVGPDAPPVVIAAPEHRGTLTDRLPDHCTYERAILQRGGNRTISVLGYDRTFGGQSVLFMIRADGSCDRLP